MNEIEALMWRSERHPAQSSTITAVMLLDCAPDWVRLVEAHRWAVSAIPRSRQRVLEPILPVGLPAWVEDEDFDLTQHLWHTRLPAGHDVSGLFSVAQDFAMRPLDRNRPLWEAMLVEGLPDGRAAYVLKMHHSLTDGIGGIQLLSSLQSDTRAHTPGKPVPEFGGTAGPTSSVRLTIDEVSEGVWRSVGAAAELAKAGARSLRAPLTTATRALRYASSLRRVLTPPAGGSPLLADRTGERWRFTVMECELDRLRHAAKAAGGSVNDAFVAALLGGLRRYHEKYDTDVAELPVAMPISLRSPDDPLGGNKFTAAIFAAPLALRDPAARIRALSVTTRALRQEAALDAFSVLAPLLNRAPTAVAAAAGRLGARADLSASNVRGQTAPSYLAGARVDRVFPFGPLPGVAVMAAMISHVGTCCIGINIDGAAVVDHGVLADCFADGLEEVLALNRGLVDA